MRTRNTKPIPSLTSQRRPVIPTIYINTEIDERMVNGLARREESKLSAYKKWKPRKSQVSVPEETSE